jgi:DNA-binding MarR family transcriptional regulator
MSKTVSTLCERGYLQRAQSKEDRRRVVIQLTDDGVLMLEKIRKHTESHIAEILKPLSTEDKQKLIVGLTILKKAFNGTTSLEERSR